MERSKLYLSGVSMAAMAASFFVAGSAQAQTASAEPVETVIVTGTSQARVDMRTPMVASSISSERLSVLSANSAADLLAAVPALKAEGGGGEVAANIFVAGLPSGGQYQFTPIEFNGTPVIGSMGLNSSAPDVYYRPDLGVERLEFVRGGVSNLFGVGGIGGVINYIDKTGSDTTEVVAQLEGSDQERVRADFAASGPIANDFYYAVSGFYRYDDGPLKSGLPTEGYQIRGNITREFSSGEVSVYFQAINDVAQFYGDIPLTGVGYKPAPGNDGHKVYTTETAALDTMSFLTPDGTFHTKVEDGAATKGGAVGVRFKKDIGDGWGINGDVNVADYRHSFALFSGGDNITNLPTTQAGFLSDHSSATYLGSASGTAYTSAFTYADSGAAVPANYLIWGDRVTDRFRPITSYTGEINLTKVVASGDWTHHLTLGGFFSHTIARDNDITYSYIGDFENSPRLINVTVTNPTTHAQTIVSRNGMVDAGLGYTNNYADARRYAGYFADQMEVGNWILDVGGRFESEVGKVKKEQTATVTSDTTANLSPALAQVAWGNGRYLTGTVNPSAWALAAAALYRLDDHISLFLNASRGFFMPELRSVGIDSNNDVQSFKPEIIKQVEGGLKFADGRISASLAGFYTTLANRRNVTIANGPTPGSAPVEIVNMISTESYGLEGVFNIRLMDGLSFESNATYEHDEYTQYTSVSACLHCVGNTLQRQPDIMANAGLYYDDGRFDGAFYDTYTGRTYTSDLNNIKLPGYHIVRLNLGYTLPFAGGDKARLGLSVYNLLDSVAATEGSPRQGNAQNVGQAYFIGRDVLPRRVSLQLNYRF